MRARPACGVRVVLTLLLLAGCRGAETPVYTTQFIAFDSAVDLSIVGMLKEDAQAAAAEVERDLAFIDRTTHAWGPGPMVRVNELLATGEPFAAPPSLLPLLRQSQELALKSQDLFNPAIGLLHRLWGFDTDEPECRPPPDESAIARLVEARPSMSDLYIDGIMLQSDNPALRLNFRGIVTGYAMDLAIQDLRSRGIRHAMINKGSDVRVIGDRAGRPWRVTVRRGNGTGVLGILEIIGDTAVFTRSEHELNFLYDGRIFHDIIDPRSGHPAQGIRAVTVLNEGSAAVADAGATALMVAGMDGWHAMAERLGLSHVLLIDEAGTVHMTPAMAARIELLDAQADVVLSPPALGPAADG
jgi:thiamine biosynthesis lipoprotein